MTAIKMADRSAGAKLGGWCSEPSAGQTANNSRLQAGQEFKAEHDNTGVQKGKKKSNITQQSRNLRATVFRQILGSDTSVCSFGLLVDPQADPSPCL